MFSRPRGSVWRYLIAATLMGVLVSSSGHALYLSGKAWLAQQLLYDAWQESVATGSSVKPWPWADTHPRALLDIPRLAITQVVLNDHSGESMAFGPGMAEGGSGIVLAGHRDSHFAFLEELEVGDQLGWRKTGEERREFRVTSTQILDTRLQEQIIPPDDSLLLITCYPFDAVNAGGPLRYVVVARKLARF